MKAIRVFFPLLFFLLNLQGQGLPLLKVSDDGHYLVTSEGDPFFWLGGTAWELIHRLDREEVDLYLEDRAGKGFTVIQTVILAELDGLNVPNAYGHLPLIDKDPSRINEPYFGHVDYVLQKTEELGIYIGLLPTWGDKFNKAWGRGPLIFTPENAEAYGEILGGRYADRNNIIWILGGDRPPADEEDRQIIGAMARGIRKFDTRHLITYHPSGGRNATDYFSGEDWLDFDMFQTGHKRSVLDFEFVTKSRNTSPARPVVNGEPRYENHPNRFRPAQFGWMDDSDIRVAAWWSMLSGAAGYTYGCHDIWQMYHMERYRKSVNGARTNWDEALHHPGSKHVMHMKRLVIIDSKSGHI